MRVVQEPETTAGPHGDGADEVTAEELSRLRFIEEDLMLVVSHFHPMNFAGDVRCPTLVGFGKGDEVVPAPTVYAIADHLGGPHEVMELPVSHTVRPEETRWERFEAYWLRLALGGVRADFGRKYVPEL